MMVSRVVNVDAEMRKHLGEHVSIAGDAVQRMISLVQEYIGFAVKKASLEMDHDERLTLKPRDFDKLTGNKEDNCFVDIRQIMKDTLSGVGKIDAESYDEMLSMMEAYTEVMTMRAFDIAKDEKLMTLKAEHILTAFGRRMNDPEEAVSKHAHA